MTQCMDGQQALSLIRRRNVLPDIVLLDVTMPGQSGFEVCSKLREWYTPSQLPVIMVSAKNREKEVVMGLKVN